MIIDDDAAERTRPERNDDARPNDRASHTVGDGVRQEIKLRNGDSDAYQQGRITK
jgi:hypothetical protein